MIKGKKILITGGTGSFGHHATRRFLESGAVQVVIFSRDEYKQMLMKKKFPDPRVCFKIGDVRDLDRLTECSAGMDLIVHAAAMKHIDFCELNKTEAQKTNVLGSSNVVEAAIRNTVPLSINLSADKAVYPAGVYGVTKAESERIFQRANVRGRERGKECRFASLRYSNVLGSRGSVVEIFEKKLQAGEEIMVFNTKMIRLIITQDQVVSMVEFAMNRCLGGETYLVESPVIRISDLAQAMCTKIGKGRVKIQNSVRPGEKFDAVLLSEEEATRTLKSGGFLVVIPSVESREKFVAEYGADAFDKGEYGTQNARYLQQDEIISMIYEGNAKNQQVDNQQANQKKLALEGGVPVRKEFLPYATQWIGEEEKKSIMEVLESNWLTTGPKVREFEERIANFVGAKYAIAVNSGTAALHCSVGAININPGDEVITTPFTFLATANVIVYRGGIPILVDIEEDTYNIDPAKIRQAITPRTKAIIPVHYAGHPCNLDEINKIAQEHNLRVIEDAAHALSAEYSGQKIGSIGDLTVFSFHPVKNITTAEGGIITTNDEKLAKLCVMHRTHGITKEAMQRYGKNADWMYDMQRLGHRYNMTEFQGALGIPQLEKIYSFQKRREEIVNRYNKEFHQIQELIIPKVRENVKSAWHLYPIRVKESQLNCDRNQIIKALKAENIGVNVHYIPVHLHSYYQKKFGFSEGSFPITENVYNSIITLPLFPKMVEQDIVDVVKAVNKVLAFYRKK